MKMPSQGLTREQVFESLAAYRAGDRDTLDGKSFGYAYHAGREAAAVAAEAYAMFLKDNALDPTLFPSLVRLETELVAIGAAHLGGDAGVVGSFTSGGTESILLAVKAARDHARAHRPEVARPEMVLPETAHAAFHKAGHLLGVALRSVPVDARTFKLDVAAARNAITPETILLVGSAPSYAHGVVDPITELAALAEERDLWLHVDACIGGVLLPYFARLGAAVPPFDFRVPGVTSISVDLHKYAYAAKGASLILYRDAARRQHQLFACAAWPGYSVVNPTMAGSKTGGAVAAAWAVVQFLGDEGFLDAARVVLEATRRLVAGLDGIDGVSVLGRPEMSLIAFRAEAVNVFLLADELKARGWHVQPQLAFGASRENIHLTVTPANAAAADAFLADVQAALEAVRGQAPDPQALAVRDVVARMDPDALDAKAFTQLLALAGVHGGAVPERMADVNEVLNVLPTRLKEALLTSYFNDLFRLRPPEGADG